MDLTKKVPCLQTDKWGQSPWGPAGEKAGSAPVFDDGHGFEIAPNFHPNRPVIASGTQWGLQCFFFFPGK